MSRFCRRSGDRSLLVRLGRFLLKLLYTSILSSSSLRKALRMDTSLDGAGLCRRVSSGLLHRCLCGEDHGHGHFARAGNDSLDPPNA